MARRGGIFVHQVDARLHRESSNLGLETITEIRLSGEKETFRKSGIPLQCQCVLT